jgi:demethylmenaquinone methyltransferase / 2-methoxy-6-polyprenyl-1,4-benzoquinol methylase
MSARTAHARALFAPLGPTYDRVGAVLSLGQDPLWRRFLVSRLPRSCARAESPSGDPARANSRGGGHVLDVAAGTGLVSEELLRCGFRVTALDQSPEMLDLAQARLDGRAEVVEASAESLPFADASVDHLTFTYLLRYVDDPAATLTELARVVRPGGLVASLEFGVPGGLAQPLWDLYVDVGLPLAGRVLGRGWDEVGAFLGGSIRDFWERWPLERQLELWRDAGLRGVEVRRLSLGGGVVMWGRRA